MKRNLALLATVWTAFVSFSAMAYDQGKQIQATQPGATSRSASHHGIDTAKTEERLDWNVDYPSQLGPLPVLTPATEPHAIVESATTTSQGERQY